VKSRPLGAVLVALAACQSRPRIEAPERGAPDPLAQESSPMNPSSSPDPIDAPRPPRENRLACETSPYLLQHAHNPVDWYPWGSEAFARAKELDRPIFLSIGYSACHWCHVMERESFEDEAIARLMNELFVCIKVDREERPDVDDVYMKAVQILTQGGGWPMSVWLTPDGRPFFGGTYFPPEDKYGRAGFPKVCAEMGRLWKEERQRVLDAADALTGEVRKASTLASAGGSSDAALPEGLVARAADRIVRNFDPTYGGFGAAPKFPHPMELALLVRADARIGKPEARHAALFTLEKMAAGGIYDQVGGGFHRYSTDERWLVPHFEKMLYDNAQLAGVYLDAFLATGDEAHARVVREILDYVLREMTSPEGGFHSTQDADSEGEEGKFFVWTPDELEAALGADLAAWIGPFFGVSREGNFEHGASILSRPWSVADFAKARSMSEEQVAAGIGVARCKLFGERSKRVAPARDDKVLADWNGLMIGAFARAGFHLAEPRYLDAARKSAAFARAKLWSEEGGGSLKRSWKDGQAKHAGNLADFACLAEGFLELHQAGFDPADLAFARRLVDVAIARFADEGEGGFFFTASDHETLIARPKDPYDGATPSGPSVMASNLVRLAELTGEEAYRARALRMLALYRRLLEQHPQAVGRMLWAVDFLESRPREVVLAGPSEAALAPLVDVLRKSSGAHRVVLVATPQSAGALSKLTSLLEGREPAAGGTPSAYVCRDGACKLPVTDPARLAEELAAE
jgi:uncharacterized protein YyaL (SSP411 family)